MNIYVISPEEWALPDRAFEATGAQPVRMTGALAALRGKVALGKPDILLLGGFAPDDATLQQVEALCAALPATAVIPYFPAPSPDYLVRMMQAGVREVLTEDTVRAVAGAIERFILRSARGRSAGDEKRARRIGFIAAKGGDGATCLAANFATMIALSDLGDVLMLDLSIPFGDAEMYLTNDKPAHDLLDFSNEIERLDNALVEAMVHPVNAHLDLISSPTSFDRIVDVSPDHIGDLVEKVSEYYRFLVLDLGSNIDPLNVALLEKLDALYIVSTLEMPSARRTGQIIQLWDSLDLDAGKLSIIINRQTSRSGLKPNEFEEAVGREVTLSLPEITREVQGSLIRGTSVVELYPKLSYTKILTKWVQGLQPTDVEEKSLWRRLRKS